MALSAGGRLLQLDAALSRHGARQQLPPLPCPGRAPRASPPSDFVRRPARWLLGLAETEATLTWSPNFGFALAARKVRLDDVRDVDLSRVRAFWNAAERIHPETLQAFHERFAALGVRRDALKTNYGCAENVGGATFSDPQGAPCDRACRRPPSPDEGDRGTRSRRRGRAERGPDRRRRPPSPQRPRRGPLAAGTASPRRPGRRDRPGDSLPDERVPGRPARQPPSALPRPAPHGRSRGMSGGPSSSGWAVCASASRFAARSWIRAISSAPCSAAPSCARGASPPSASTIPRGGTQRIVLAVEVRDSTANVEALGTLIRGQVHRDLGVTVNDLIFLPPGSLPKTSSGKRRHQHFRERYLEGKLHPVTEPEGAMT